MANLLDVHEVLHETDIVRVSWLSDQRDIALMEIKKQWNWQTAIVAVEVINKAVMAQPHPVYTVYIYQMQNTPLFPTGVKLANLRRLIEIDPPNEQLVIFVRTDGLLRRFVYILSKTYGLRHVLKKYQFVDTWQQALEAIQRHRATQGAS